MTKPLDSVTVVIPIHNAIDRVDRVNGWRLSLEKGNRPFELLIVDDGSTDGTAEKLSGVPHARLLRHEKPQGFGACLRTALAETNTPFFFYTSLDYPYTPSDIRPMFEQINLRDEVFGKQPDLISGCRTGLPKPELVTWSGRAWRLFWRVFAGMPAQDPPPWHGWTAYRYRVWARWIYGVPLADVNSCFKLYRTDFLKRFPIQSDGDFVHTELVAKATFLTSIMDEVPLTSKPDPLPQLGDISADRRRLSANRAQFAFEPVSTPTDLSPEPPAVPVP